MAQDEANFVWVDGWTCSNDCGFENVDKEIVVVHEEECTLRAKLLKRAIRLDKGLHQFRRPAALSKQSPAMQKYITALIRKSIAQPTYRLFKRTSVPKFERTTFSMLLETAVAELDDSNWFIPAETLATVRGVDLKAQSAHASPCVV